MSCNNEPKVEEETRIIYELDQKYSNFIINHFEEKFNENSDYLDKFNFEKQYVQIGNVKSDIGSTRVAFYTNREIRGYIQLASKTNRFLKLSNNYIIPIVFLEDILYVKNKEKFLGSVMGGGKVFYLNERKKTITWVAEM